MNWKTTGIKKNESISIILSEYSEIFHQEQNNVGLFHELRDMRSMLLWWAQLRPRQDEPALTVLRRASNWKVLVIELVCDGLLLP